MGSLFYVAMHPKKLRVAGDRTYQISVEKAYQ